MIVTRTRAFGITVIFAARIQSRRQPSIRRSLSSAIPSRSHRRLRPTVRAKRARAAGMSPAARALRSDVVRRAASRGGTLRCAKARRVAYRDVDESYASHRLS